MRREDDSIFIFALFGEHGMSILYSIDTEAALHWVWDIEKDQRNRQKHKLPLSIGEVALTDPLAVSQPDPHPDGDRWNTVAVVEGMTLLIVHTWPDDDEGIPGRIISVRLATKSERKGYENDWQ